MRIPSITALKINLPNYAKNSPATTKLSMTNPADSCSFKGKPQSIELIDDLRDIPDLPCAICGELMIPNFVYTKFNSNKADLPSKKVIEAIEPYSDRLKPHEKRIYLTLKNLSVLHPNSTIKEILNKPKISTHYLEALETKQLSVLSATQYLAGEMEPKSQENFSEAINIVKNIIADKDPATDKKRKTILGIFYRTKVQKTDNVTYRQIIKILEKLPTSRTDLSAFMVKYSRRESNETIQNMLQSASATNEHIVPHHNLTGKKGASAPHNYVVEHQCCNQKRGQKEYSLMVDENPSIPENMQKHADTVILYKNAGQLNRRYDNYPECVAETLFDNSEHKINIDTSAAKAPNRAPFCGKRK